MNLANPCFLSIILPTYNERENLKVIIPRIEETFKDTAHEIVVVDDNSSDGTIACVEEMAGRYGNIKLLKRPRKAGISSALRDGYNYTSGDILLSSDADLSFSVDDMLRLVRSIKSGADLVLGCRHDMNGSYYEIKNTRTAIKGLISKLGNIVLRLLTGTDIHDFSANFRAMKKSAWEALDVRENTNIMLFETIIKAKFMKMKIEQLPVAFKDRIYGKSKLRLSVEIPKYTFKMFYYIIRYRF